MKKVLLLLAKGFEIYEASVFIDVIGWNKTYGTCDTELFTCGLTKEIKSTFAINVVTDFLIKDIIVDEYDALAIPGGFENYGFYDHAFSPEFLNIVNQFNAQKKTIATICVGALPLGKSGILKDRKATTYHLSDKKRQIQLKEFGADVIDEPVVCDDNIITSWAPSTALDVAFALLTKLTNEENCKHIKYLMGF